VPWFGLSWTFLAAGATLFLVALALTWTERGKAALALALFPLGAALAVSRLGRGPTLEGFTLLDARESLYQSIRVVEDRRWREPLRLLQVNEGLDSFQSVWQRRPGLLGPGYYYDLFALPAWWARRAGAWKVLVLGLGAGTTFRVLDGASPPGCELELWGVEIDAAVVELGVRWFELDRARANVHVLPGRDGRAALRGLPVDFDLIVLDAYAHQVEIPFHLATREAFSEIRAHLAPHGWLAVNVGGFGFDDPVVAAVGATLADVFPAPIAYRVPRSRNFVLFARVDASVPRPFDDAFGFEGSVADALLPALSLPGAWHAFGTSGAAQVLRDDRSPIDQLQMRSLEQGRGRVLESL